MYLVTLLTIIPHMADLYSQQYTVYCTAASCWLTTCGYIQKENILLLTPSMFHVSLPWCTKLLSLMTHCNALWVFPLNTDCGLWTGKCSWRTQTGASVRVCECFRGNVWILKPLKQRAVPVWTLHMPSADLWATTTSDVSIQTVILFWFRKHDF